ncbi:MULTISPECIES: EpsG family protein [Exiguobacterium]|uniref:EpsG family protein n=1 Tax=Exiguobacterium TaxID=33986 RepID=UPI001BED24FC|nr:MULTISPECIES: EpsG family protein [Exiguobacterium]MCT4781659.1 EpsG family protein [Exiguobacterium himgiriensis]
MVIYLINMMLLIAWAFLLLRDDGIRHGKALFVSIATLQWIVLSGFRHVSVGADTLQYKWMFDETKAISWNRLGDHFMAILFGEAEGRDPGYYILQKTTQIVTDNYQWYLLIVAVLFLVPFGIWIYRNSTEPLLSFIIFSTLFYAFFAITGIRQTLATAIAVLIGYYFIQQRRFWPFLAIVLLAATIHKSALVFIPFYFLATKTITTRYLLFMGALIPFLFVFRIQLFELFRTISGYEEYEYYAGAGTLNFSLMLLVITGVAIWRREQMIAANPNVTHYLNALLLALCFLPLTFINPSMMRIVQYFSIFIMLLIPELIRSFDQRERLLVYYTAITMLMLLFARYQPVYQFFWQ